jgi:hypothetical protein
MEHGFMGRVLHMEGALANEKIAAYGVIAFWGLNWDVYGLL